MTGLDIARRRLTSQRIVGVKFNHPGEAVTWLGALQAQDYGNAKWAVGLRCSNTTEASVDQAIADKSILRTWVLRGTLHFVAAEDIHWILALIAPRLIAQKAGRNRQLGLDASAFARSRQILIETLQGGRRATRVGIMQALEQGGVSPQGQRGYHVLQRAALEGLICFGPMQGKQPTFVLLDEWVPHGRLIDGEQALAELARRYFTSHGPATERDFAWWSGLAAAQARAGLELVKAEFQHESLGDQSYWLREDGSNVEDMLPNTFLLPGYDEYYLGYADRSAILNSKYEHRAVSSNGVFRPMIIVDGQIVGIWQRSAKKDSLTIRLEPFEPLAQNTSQALVKTAEAYGAFLERRVELA